MTHIFQIWLFLATSGLIMYGIGTWIMDRREMRAERKHNAILALAHQTVQLRYDAGMYSSLEEAQTDYEFEIIALYALTS